MMVKPAKSLRKQAEKAEAVANRISDPDTVAGMRALADAFRTQADMIKNKNKNKPKGKTKRKTGSD
jgi:hypothetical protein